MKPRRVFLTIVLACACAILAAAPSARAGVVITPAAGYNITWNGNDGLYYDQPVPANLAKTPAMTPFGSSAYPAPAHTVAHINDGLYGNYYSWLADPGDPSPQVGVYGPRTQFISSFAFGRDNALIGGVDPGYQLTDRSVGYTYNVQYTQVGAPTTALATTGNPLTGWASIGTLNYASNDDTALGGLFTGYYRHEYAVTKGGQPLQATGIRIAPSSNAVCIDELELYGPAASAAVVPSGLRAWYKGDAGMQTYAASGRVRNWADQSGLNNDAVQASEAQAGTVAPAAIAGKDVLHITPSQWINAAYTGTAMDIANKDYEIFVVARSGEKNNVQFLTAGGGGNLGHYELHLNGQGENIGARFIPAVGGDNSRYADFGIKGQFANNQPTVFNTRVEGNVGYLAVNGVQSYDTVPTNARSSVNNYLTMGVRGDASYPFNGDIAEVLVYNRALSPSERQAVNQYLMTRWNVPKASNFHLGEVGGGPVQYNVASSARGGVAFAQDLLNNGGYPSHQIAHLNDGLYGNGNSWIGAADPSFAGVAFLTPETIDAIAFGRDNGGEAQVFIDREEGIYTLQYTNAPRSSVLANPSAVEWYNIEAVIVTSSATSHLRHLYEFDPIPNVTAVRVITDTSPVNSQIAIDELEVRAVPEPATMACLGLAASALGGYLRRRRQ